MVDSRRYSSSKIAGVLLLEACGIEIQVHDPSLELSFTSNPRRRRGENILRELSCCERSPWHFVGEMSVCGHLTESLSQAFANRMQAMLSAIIAPVRNGVPTLTTFGEDIWLRRRTLFTASVCGKRSGRGTGSG